MGGVRRRREPPSRRRARSAERRNTRSDLGARLLAAVPLALIAIVLVALGGWIFTAGLAVIAVICLRELFTMYERARPVVFGGFLSAVGLLVAAQAGEATTVLLAFVIAVPVVFVLGILQPRGAGMPGVTITIFGLAWIGLAFAHAVLLRELPHGGGILVVVLVATFVGDTGAYLGGRMFGRRPLATAISPNKTIEGLLIGIVAGTIAAWFAGLYQDWLTGIDALLIGLGAAIAGPLGDLFESFVKREAGRKDSGTIFGPHGGALDRLDAVMFTVVVGYYAWRAMLG